MTESYDRADALGSNRAGPPLIYLLSLCKAAGLLTLERGAAFLRY